MAQITKHTQKKSNKQNGNRNNLEVTRKTLVNQTRTNCNRSIRELYKTKPTTANQLKSQIRKFVHLIHDQCYCYSEILVKKRFNTSKKKERNSSNQTNGTKRLHNAITTNTKQLQILHCITHSFCARFSRAHFFSFLLLIPPHLSQTRDQQISNQKFSVLIS